ncbi:hypothetical protein [Peribacillus loiseleuriae]|uniref:hypothetical protein n=1 Tax=Peribacillus loiseleuriae TaxID=1679170 RepID=UPI003CFC0DB2
MRRYETASIVFGHGAENRRRIGQEAQKRAKAWRAANPGKLKATSEQRAQLCTQIDKALKLAK